ncbi:facilitated trehalose transporter Tret1-like [Pectinophora gossypiella]|uniref:facilitated trehalose transporter Tret1-like n=1 Tax=Pectinophora gossypiella TaxID=13191 RepID=UPI00214E601D|nr:facilitated trehalose transporter Tret1-like [Pectinophora gossypiella]
MVNKVYKVSSEKGPQQGSKHNQILMSIVVCLPILAYGTAMGWISPHKALLMGNSSPSHEPSSEEAVSWMASIMFIFAPIAVFIYGAAADKFGRKNALLCASVPIALGWAVKLICAHPIALIGARALIGFGSGGAFVVCPLYVKEISEDSIRGMTGTFIIFSQTMGNLLVFILGDLLAFNTVLWICMAIPLVHFCILLRLPETPSYLIKCGKKEETAKTLSWLRSLPVDDKMISEEVDRLLVEQTTSEPKFSPMLLFSNKTAVKAFWVALIVNLTREFCGCIAVLVYASHIFAEAGKDPHTSIALTPNKQSILLAAVQIFGSFLACQLVDRAGRKPLLAVTSVVAGFSMCLLGVWFYLQSIGVYMPGWVPIVALCTCIFADASGLQPLPFVIMTEMFSFQLRGTVATLIMAISLGTDFALLKVFAPLNSWIGYHSTFWIFSCICLSNVFYLIFCVPETKMRSLEDIYADLEGRKRRTKEEEIVETNHV